MLPGAHIGGIPVEETLAALSPALTIGVGVTVMTFRDRLRRLLPRLRRSRVPPER